jgi:hypothetical protein
MRFAGDDTGLCFVKKRYAQEIAERMRILCAPKQQQITHGLGLVLKGTCKRYSFSELVFEASFVQIRLKTTNQYETVSFCLQDVIISLGFIY